MRTIALRISKVYGAAPLDEVLLDTNRYKETIKWTRVVGWFDDPTARLIRLFVRVGGTDITLKWQVQTAALNSVQFESPVYLSGDYRIGMFVNTGLEGQTMELSAFGVVEEPVTV